MPDRTTTLLPLALILAAACAGDGPGPKGPALPVDSPEANGEAARNAPSSLSAEQAATQGKETDSVPEISTPFPPPPDVAGSAGSGPTGEGSGPAEEAPRAPWPAEEGIGTLSNGGRYWVVYLPPQPEIPLNEDFEIELRVFDGKTRTRLAAAEVQVDARMPAHGHGMKIDAEAVRNPDGSYRVPILLLHMTGHWELYVDLTEGALTERAQFDIDLE